jgi:hypothetical protein
LIERRDIKQKLSAISVQHSAKGMKYGQLTDSAILELNAEFFIH